MALEVYENGHGHENKRTNKMACFSSCNIEYTNIMNSVDSIDR